jgi:hypothetical protein
VVTGVLPLVDDAVEMSANGVVRPVALARLDGRMNSEWVVECDVRLLGRLGVVGGCWDDDAFTE